jgi:hypothetical protein
MDKQIVILANINFNNREYVALFPKRMGMYLYIVYKFDHSLSSYFHLICQLYFLNKNFVIGKTLFRVFSYQFFIVLFFNPILVLNLIVSSKIYFHKIPWEHILEPGNVPNRNFPSMC